MKKQSSRRQFIQQATLAGLSFSLPFQMNVNASGRQLTVNNKRIGLIGLDTSHSTNFMKLLNGSEKTVPTDGYAISAAFPYGSRDIKSSCERIPSYIEEAKKYNIEIVDSIDALLQKSDFVLLETNDGKPRLEQAMQVIKAGKPMFIDKPIAANFKDVVNIYKAAEKYKVPLFSSSTLRYTTQIAQLVSGEKIGKITGADTYSPAPVQDKHTDLFWYGIHAVEPLYTLLGTGCSIVTSTHTTGTDLVTGIWADGRIGSVRGIRTGADDYGGTAFGEKGIAPVGTFQGYEGLFEKVIRFFNTGIPPVPAKETLEIYAFMQAADWSKQRGGIPVKLNEVYNKSGLHL
ncbi:MAG: Gfo/Idh/MocA family oxidoreductase [Chitinophagaceae bacterium]|nr:Gfo/Idh/MocA family oxidoreductase [Chitinophagaceae bacterium]